MKQRLNSLTDRSFKVKTSRKQFKLQKTAWPKFSHISYFQKSQEKDELSKKEQIRFNFCWNASKQKSPRVQPLPPLLSARPWQRRPSLLSPLTFPSCGESLRSKPAGADTDPADSSEACYWFRGKEVEHLHPNVSLICHITTWSYKQIKTGFETNAIAKPVWRVPKKITRTLTICPSHSTTRYLPRKKENTCPYRNFHMTVK